MTKLTLKIAIPLLILSITFLYGYNALSKGQQKSEAITNLNERSITERDRKHSRLFPRYKTGKKLSSRAFLEQESNSKQLPNEIVVKRRPPVIDIALERPCPKSPKPWLVGLAHAADVIVVGTIKDKTASQLTEDEEFLFSEHSIVVEQVIKDNPSAPIGVGSAVNVVRPGGRAQLHGKVISAVVPSFPPFLGEERYILFLKFISDTQSYQAFSNGSFPIEDEVVRTPQAARPKHDQQAFIAEVKDAMTSELCQNVILN